MDGLKTCTKCQETKEVSAFRNRIKRGKPYLNAQCRECERAFNREGYRAGKWTYQPTYRRHGLSEGAYQEMYKAQSGLCANPTCSNPATVIDHDHACCPGKRSCGECVVGLLCPGCNAAEGLLESNANKALGLAEYIIKTRKVKENAMGA